tara:strand:+ start:1292 stop:1486 length:195 start_codon:yes stop_codon:yes gene_type:complete
MKVGDLVESKSAGDGLDGRIGVIIKLREGAFEDEPLIQVFWPHRPTAMAFWLDSKDMEVIDESR